MCFFEHLKLLDKTLHPQLFWEGMSVVETDKVLYTKIDKNTYI